MGYVWHYDPHGIITKKRENIKASTYEHEYRLELEWKANLNSWPINIDMEVETPTTKNKLQKRTVDEIGDVEMEYVTHQKKSTRPKR